MEIGFEEKVAKEIVKAIEKYYGCTLLWPVNTRQSEYVSEAKRMYCALTRDITGLPLEKIGTFIDRSHASVINMLKKHNGFQDAYKNERTKYDAVKKYVKSEIAKTVIQLKIDYHKERLEHFSNLYDKAFDEKGDFKLRAV